MFFIFRQVTKRRLKSALIKIMRRGNRQGCGISAVKRTLAVNEPLNSLRSRRSNGIRADCKISTFGFNDVCGGATYRLIADSEMGKSDFTDPSAGNKAVA